MNISDIRDKRPIWPTFRGATFREEDKLGLRRMPNLMYFGTGEHKVHLLPNGGFGRHGHPDSISCPVLSWEREYWTYNVKRERKSKLYLLAWLGFYPPGERGGKGGAILHVGWQFPHMKNFVLGGNTANNLESIAFKHYSEVAFILYEGRRWDKDVERFVVQGSERLSREDG